MHDTKATALEKIKSTASRIATTVGVAIGVLISVYFFTFATLIDHGASGLLMFQGISTVIMIGMLFFLKRIGFFGARLFLGFREPYRAVFANLTLADLDKVDIQPSEQKQE